MTPDTKKLLEVLESRFGVRSEVAGRLAPALERLAERDRSSDEWIAILLGMAEASRCTEGAQVAGRRLGEIQLLVQQFLGELRKVDESLKVLCVYMERIRDQVKPSPDRVLH